MKLRMSYWIVTGLMAAFMLMASVPDVLRAPGAVAIFRHLGYPHYLLPFLGAAKMLGVIAVLLPAVAALKEWAYAGLTFDLVGALYSHVAAGDPPSAWLFAVLGLLLVAGSYLLHRRRSAFPRAALGPAQGHETAGIAFGMDGADVRSRN